MTEQSLTPNHFAKFCAANLERHRRSPALGSVGGNMVFMFPGMVNFAVVTQGTPEFLTFEEEPPGDHDCHFLFLCDPAVFNEVFLEPGADFAALHEAHKIYMSGDSEVFQRFLKLDQGASPLATRLAAVPGVAKS